jgi:hypothetical protein
MTDTLAWLIGVGTYGLVGFLGFILGRTRRHTVMNRWFCVCGTAIDGVSDYCRRCGRRLHSKCPRCATKISVGDIHCPGCGAKVKGEKVDHAS